MNALTKTEESPVAEYGDSILAIIAKAASDPNVDIDKMDRLLQMQERVQNRAAELEFNTAMNAAQSEMRPISADASNPQTRSKYATHAKLDRALRPIYTAHGFSLSFDEGESPKPDHIRVLCYVAHTGGFSRTYHRDMPADGKGAKGGDVMTKTHAAGAAGSYGARYLLKGIWNVAVGEEDQDGNDVGPTHPISVSQYNELGKRIRDLEVNEPVFFKVLQHNGPLEELPASKFARAMQQLDVKAKQSSKAGA